MKLNYKMFNYFIKSLYIIVSHFYKMISSMKRRVSVSDGSEMHSQFLDPPEYFGIVTEHIFRCGAISPVNFSFLSLYEYKSVLFLGEDSPHQCIVDFLKNKETHYIRIPTYSHNSNLTWRTQLDELMKNALQFILNKNNLPVLISSPSEILQCTLIGCLRRMQKWNISSIMSEFSRFCPEISFTQNTNYVELFDFDLVELPESTFITL